MLADILKMAGTCSSGLASSELYFTPQLVLLADANAAHIRKCYTPWLAASTFMGTRTNKLGGGNRCLHNSQPCSYADIRVYCS